MVLSGAQTTDFFDEKGQMAIPHATVIPIHHKRIDHVNDLADFEKDTLNQVANNLRRPGGCILDPNTGYAAGSTIPTPSFVFGVKS